ncbi:hypothetical protein [Echinicola soli]|uniref:hypothetical protein n=1 Tax=Echinicola soli TaxID=2591634 RepID=UPI00143D9C8C|nr:hypothetical protein [Echinicola soli]
MENEVKVNLAGDKALLHIQMQEFKNEVKKNGCLIDVRHSGANESKVEPFGGGS